MRKVLITSLMVLVTGLLAAQSPEPPPTTHAVSGGSSLELEIGTSALIPLRSSSSLFRVGVTGSFLATLTGRSPAYVGGGVGYTLLPTPAEASLNLIHARAGGGLSLGSEGGLGARLGIYAGGYVGLYGDLVAYNPSLAASARVSYSPSPALNIGAEVGYEYFIGSIGFDGGFAEQSLAEGLSAGISVAIRPGAAGSVQRRPQIEILPPVFDNVFPVFYRYYNDNPIGSVTIVNEESDPIQNVTVSFVASQFMDAPKVSATIERIEPGEEVEVPLLALFRDSVLTITEGTSVASEVVVDYEIEGEPLSASATETLPIRNRNNMTWDDDRKAAAFVTSNDPTISRFARNVTSAVRSTGATAVNERLRLAMAIFEALRIYGIEYVIDPDSSYVELSENAAAIDYLQFPQQTLDFRSGDCDDLSILYAALLESVGVPTAFLTIPGHIYMALGLEMSEEEARSTFSRPQDLVFVDGQTWVPVEVTLVREDFLDAWSTGAKQWRENAANDSARLYPIRDAWRTYQPTGFGSEPLDIAIPQADEIVPVYTALLASYVQREIAPQVADLEERIQASNGSPRIVNRLGAVYARYGLYDEAEEAFRDALGDRPYLPALMNLGHIAFLREDLISARDYYSQALEVRSDDPLALVSLSRVHFELAEYAQATERYRAAEVLDPELAAEFAYIVSETDDSVRASSAQERNRVIWDEE